MFIKIATHKLYHIKDSIWSFMVRYTYAVRGEPNNANNDMRLTEEEINIMQGEQLTEHFLCGISVAGGVGSLWRRRTKSHRTLNRCL
jgi:hypothetical protein